MIRNSTRALAAGAAAFCLLAAAWGDNRGQAPAAAATRIAVAAPAARPDSWAVPLELPGLPNLHRVSANLYRGAQPTAEGFHELRRMGVRTIINLRGFHSDRDEIDTLPFRRIHVRFNTWHAEDEDVIAFLRMVQDSSAGPFFVHCQHGADRTGTMCAIYRVVAQGWSMDEAIKEMTEGGYGYHAVWKNLLDYLHKLDVKSLKRRAGGGPAPAPR